MTITPKALFTGGQAPSTAAAMYTAPANTKAIVTGATFTNTDTVNRLLTVYVVRKSGTAGNANILIDQLPLAPAQAYTSSELPATTLASGDALWWLADVAAKITCAGVNGFEST